MMADLFGNNLANNLTEGVAADNILGAGENDNLNGGGGNHSIYGDWANDSLNSGAGEDLMYGGEGNDTPNTLEAGIDKGIGDEVRFFPFPPYPTIPATSGPDSLTGTPGSDIIYALGGNDTVNGLAGNDRIYGDEGNDVLYGGEGRDFLVGGFGIANDTLNGEAGNDILDGEAGNDLLNGGAGNDTLTGGAGSDQFLFNTALATAGVDSIYDFSIPNDKIVLDRSVFSALETPAGNVLRITDFAEINVGAAAQVVAAGNKVNEIVYNRQTGDLFYNPNSNAAGFGAGGGRFATLVGSPNNLSNTNFRVVA